MNIYDLIVIGTGTAAQVASGRVPSAGRSVAMIDHRQFGGTCALRGCDPKKMLVSGAEVVDFARRMHTSGVEGKLRIDWKELIAFKRTFTDPIPQKREESFAKQGIAGNVAVENGRLRLNDFLQSVSNPIVYAAGDAAAKGPPLTPVSSHDAKVVATNILEGNRHRPDYRGVPSVAFTLPPIAGVGLSEDAARKQTRKARVNCAKVPDWYTARRVRESVYGYKSLVDEDSGRILGAHLVGPHADEVINLFGLAIRHNLTADDLKATIFAYPTGASDIGYML
jgi:pyruvate/2-oxoglutarate dehydrogenase complex dihydrolipoamide dehydrogenase (E3) component